jgi:predicted aldo/keto reductase-like oxidoreductase
MQYRTYGRTGVRVSALGFGAMRLPQDEDYAVEIIAKSLDLGVNYIDTAYVYGDGWSERMVGRAIKGRRDSVYIATKNPLNDATADGWWERMERSLKDLDTDHIDFYKVVHGMSWDAWENNFSKPGGGLEAALKAKEQGIISHIVISSHDSPENIIKLGDLGIFEGVLLQYNLLDRHNEEAIAHWHAKGLAIEVMGPVGGGRLGMSSERLQSLVPGVASTPELALRFVLANPGVTVAFSGMSNMEQVLENCAVAGRDEPLSGEEIEAINQALIDNQKLSELYCTGCGYCMPCPNGVGIPQVFSAMNMHRVWGLTEHAKARYGHLGPNHREGLLQADACVECGQCEPKCPQKIPIIEQLKESHAALSG